MTGHLIVPIDKISAFKETLSRHMALSRRDEGCLQFEVQQSESNPSRFEVDEVFASRTAFDLHVARVKSSEWWDFTNGFQRHYDVKER